MWVTKIDIFLKITQDDSSRVTFLGVPTQTLCGDNLKIRNTVYELTDELYKALSSMGYTGKGTKRDSDILTFNKVLNEIGYTSEGDGKSAAKKFIWDELLTKTARIGNGIEDESDEIESRGVEIIVPSNIIDVWTELEVLLGLRFGDHTVTVTEASNFLDDLYNRGDIENEQQYRSALGKNYTY